MGNSSSIQKFQDDPNLLTNLQSLSKDELFSIAIHLDLPDLISLCRLSKNINNKVCERDEI